MECFVSSILLPCLYTPPDEATHPLLYMLSFPLQHTRSPEHCLSTLNFLCTLHEAMNTALYFKLSRNTFICDALFILHHQDTLFRAQQSLAIYIRSLPLHPTRNPDHCSLPALFCTIKIPYSSANKATHPLLYIYVAFHFTLHEAPATSPCAP